MPTDAVEELGVCGAYVATDSVDGLRRLPPREDSCMSQTSDSSEFSQVTTFGDIEDAAVELQTSVEAAAPEYKLCQCSVPE